MASMKETSSLPATVDHPRETDDQWEILIHSVALSREKQFNIKSLPAELRILIFRHYLLPQGCDCIEASALVRALRPDSEMYTEVLEVFFAVRNLRVSKGNQKSIKITGREVLKRINTLEIAYTMELQKTCWEWELTSYIPLQTLRHFTNLTSINLTTVATSRHSNTSQGIIDLAKTLIIHCPTLTQLTIHLPIPIANPDTSISTGPKYIFDPITQINTNTGIPHKYLPTTQKDSVAIQWTSSSKTPAPFFHPGHRLTWTDHEYFRSIRWPNCNVLFTFLTLYHRVEFWYEQNLGFVGLNPRRSFTICPVPNCVCTRLVAMRCPIEKKAKKNDGWVGFKPFEPLDLSFDEQEARRETYRIPDDLR